MLHAWYWEASSARSGSLFSVAIHEGCALSAKSFGLLCSLCDRDRDELPGALEPWLAWLWPSRGGCPWGVDPSLGSCEGQCERP